MRTAGGDLFGILTDSCMYCVCVGTMCVRACVCLKPIAIELREQVNKATAGGKG